MFSNMETLKLTNEELAIIKTALTFRIQAVEKEIEMYREKVNHVPTGLLEMKQEYETVFEALVF